MKKRKVEEEFTPFRHGHNIINDSSRVGVPAVFCKESGVDSLVNNNEGKLWELVWLVVLVELLLNLSDLVLDNILYL